MWQRDITKIEKIQMMLKAAFVAGMAGYLFYDSWWSFVLVIPFSVVCFEYEKKELCKKREQEFLDAFSDGIRFMAEGMKVGYSVENAISSALFELKLLFPKQSRIVKEFERMVYLLHINRPAEQVMQEFSKRIKLKDIEDFVVVFSMAKRSGGDSIQMIREAVQQIREKREVEKEIQVVIAAKKFEFKIMCVIPFFIIFYMKIAFPQFMKILYKNVTGVILMSLCFAIFIGACYAGKKITDIEV